jgi:hypothetical protein
MLKFILIFILVLYAIGFIGRIILRHYLAKMASRFANGPYQHQNKRPEGEVTIEINAQKGKNYQHHVGEYVDFEEVK